MTERPGGCAMMHTDAPVADELIELRGLRFHYRDWPAKHAGAPDLVLLHGYTGHARSWDAFAQAMTDRYRVLALDQRGHGESAWAPADRYGVDDMADDLEAFVGALGLNGFTLLGLSMGGDGGDGVRRPAAEGAGGAGHRRHRAGDRGLRGQPHPGRRARARHLRQPRRGLRRGAGGQSLAARGAPSPPLGLQPDAHRGWALDLSLRPRPARAGHLAPARFGGRLALVRQHHRADAGDPRRRCRTSWRRRWPRG